MLKGEANEADLACDPEIAKRTFDEVAPRVIWPWMVSEYFLEVVVFPHWGFGIVEEKAADIF